MSFRIAFGIIWMLVAVGMAWFLHGGFGIRVPRVYQSWLTPNAVVWVLWAWAAVLILGVSFLLAYLLAKGLHIVAPRLVR